MKLNILLGGLNNPQPAVRVDIVRVLGMLDEIRALDSLRQRYQTETDPAVKSAIAWAGKRLFEAQQAGYSTIDELFRHFGIEREIENTPDAAEAEMMKKLQDNMDSDLRRMQERGNSRRIGMAVAAGLGGSLLGGTTVGMSAAMGAMMPGAGAASSGLDGRPQIGSQRTPATAPSGADISVWVRRLREDVSPGKREQAAIELAQLNNPAALPYLAAAFVSDPDPKVRQAAQRFGKNLYWSAIYWEMEQDGSLAEEMAKRAQAMGKNIPKAPGISSPGTTTAAPGSTSGAQEDVTDILRKAQAARSKRQKKL